MQISVLIGLSLLFASCRSSHEFVSVHAFAEVDGGIVVSTYDLRVPTGYSSYEVIVPEGEEHRIWYQDSAVLYISSRGWSTLNARNIERDAGLRRARARARIMSDTVTLSGVDERGRHWKEFYQRFVVVGYLNVPDSLKAVFDEAIASLRH